MSYSGPPQPPGPPLEPWPPAIKVLLLVVGIILLLPGICSVLLTVVGVAPSLILLVVSFGGVLLISAAVRGRTPRDGATAGPAGLAKERPTEPATSSVAGYVIILVPVVLLLLFHFLPRIALVAEFLFDFLRLVFRGTPD